MGCTRHDADTSHEGHAHGHDHDHDLVLDHDHDHEGRHGRIGHLLSGLFGAHSHDVSDQIDDALEADVAGRRALFISFAGLGLTAVVQAVVFVVSGSVALLGDTLHNVADALTAIPLLIAFTLARRAATRRYTYGFGRAEDLAGVAVLVAITASSAAAAYEAIRRFVHPHEVTDLWAVAAAGLVGFAGNEIVARYRIRVGRQIGSAALVADGLHARTDGFTSLAVLLGAGGVAAGWGWADPVVGLLITVAILGVLRGAAREVFGRLMDSVDPSVIDLAEHTLETTEGVRGVSDLRVRWVGHSLRVEADVAAEPTLTLTQAHELAHRAEQHLSRHLHRMSGATIHVSPAGAHDQVVTV